MTVKIHETHSGCFVVEGMEQRDEEIPAFAIPNSDSAMGATTIQIFVPKLRFAATLEKALALVQWRVSEGDLEAVVGGPGRQIVRPADGSDPVPGCDRTGQIISLDGGFMVLTESVLRTSTPRMQSKTGKDMAAILKTVAQMMPSGATFKCETHAVATIDDAIEVLREFFS